MDQAAALTALTTAIPQLSQLPSCILPAYGAIAAAGCGPDLACICGNDNFYLTVQGALLMGACPNPVDAKESFSSTQRICSKAVPWLNETRGPEVVWSLSILLAIATVAVGLRIWARRISKLSFGIDDWLIFVALLFSYALAAVQYQALRFGFAKHMLLVPSENVVPFTKIFFTTVLLFPTSIAATKLSVLFFYNRIFVGRSFRVISIIIGIVIVAWYIVFIIVAGFVACIPLAYYWDKTIPGGRCISNHITTYYATSPGDILTNIALMILPIPYLWNLQMHWQKRLAIIAIFILGSFATLGCIVRIPLFAQLKITDVTYTDVSSAIWLDVEMDIGILSVCLPMLRPVITKVFPDGFRSRFSRSRTSGNSAGSQRLQDLEKEDTTGRANTVAGSTGGSRNANIYSGGVKTHNTWYAKGGRSNDGGSEGSQEEMVPMGLIAVRQDVDWDTKQGGSAAISHV